MYQAWYGASELLALPLVSTFLFIALFAGVVAWALFSKREKFDAISALPLEHDEPRIAAQEDKP